MRKRVSDAVEAYHTRVWYDKWQKYKKEGRDGETCSEFMARTGLQSRSQEWRDRHSTIMRDFWSGLSKAARRRHKARTTLALLERKLKHNHDMGMKPTETEKLERLRKEAE